MSRKQLYNRLESLFSKLEDQIEPPSVPLASEKIPGWTWQCDQSGNYTACGLDIKQLLGISPEEAISEKVYLLGLDTTSSVKLKEIINSRRSHFEEEFIFQGANGQKSTVRMTGYSRTDSDGNFLGWSGFTYILSQTSEIDHSQTENINIKNSSNLPEQWAQPDVRETSGLDNATLQLLANKPISNVETTALENDVISVVSGLKNQPSSISVPFRVANTSRGIFEIQDQPGRIWTEDEEALVEEVTRQLALALENASLYEDLQLVANERQKFLLQAERRAIELEAAAEIARDTTQTLSLDALLSQIVNLLRERFGFYHVSIFLLDENGFYAVVKESTGLAGEELKRRGHKLAVGSKSIIGTATATKQPYIVNDVSNHPNYFANPLLPNTKGELGIPLKIGDHVIGALDVQTDSANVFSEDVVYVLQIVADQVAVAIENARAYELSQKALKEMHEIDRMKSQFLANMSHELRTPLNSIIGFSRVILKGIDGPINEIQAQDLTSIYNSGQHLLNLINDILDLSKIEAGKMTLSISDLDIKELSKSVMSTAVGLVKDKPIQLQNLIPDNFPVVVGDHTRVRQVLLNLVSNAAKFTESGSITLNAERIVTAGKSELMITVKDTGIGIEESDRHKLFLEFSQVDDSPARKSGGTGLGLSICRSLIEMHNGKIGLLESKVGEGSTFYFTLPLTEEEITETADPPKRQLLAIDEDPETVQIYQRFLKGSDFSVETSSHSKGIITEIISKQPSAVIIDIASKNLDAWTLVQQIRETPQTAALPILVCSMTDQKEKAMSLGVTEYLLKPFLRDEFLQSVHRLIHTSTTVNILAIDDNEEDIRLIFRLLENQTRYHLCQASNSVEAMAVLEKNQIDVIILDLFLPDVNGFAFLEDLKKHRTYSTAPVIVVTGADLTPAQHEKLTTFGHIFLTKGFLRSGDLINSIENALKI